MYSTLLLDIAGDLATITLNRAAVYNCYSSRTLEELAAAMRHASFDDSVGVIVLTGTGDRAFSTARAFEAGM